MTATATTFEIGKTYSCRSVCDHTCVWSYTVAGRTAKTIKTTCGKTFRINSKLTAFDGVEAVYPHGRHSMCPILRAARSELREALAADAPIAEKFTCRRVTLDLQPLPYPPQAVIATRRLLRVSQPVFAQFLGVKPATVKSWEQGRQHAPDIACRFMDEIQRNPEYWRDRLRESIRVKSM